MLLILIILFIHNTYSQNTTVSITTDTMSSTITTTFDNPTVNPTTLHMITTMSPQMSMNTYATVNSTATNFCVAGVDQCSGNGECINSSCSCYTGYDGNNCENQMKYKLTAFLLALFLGYWGAGYWYLEYWGLAIVRLILGVIICYCVGGHRQANREGSNTTYNGLHGCLQCMLFIWWIIDWALILADVVPDYPIVPFS